MPKKIAGWNNQIQPTLTDDAPAPQQETTENYRGKAHFFHKPTAGDLDEGEDFGNLDEGEDFEIIKTIELSPQQYQNFLANPSEDQPFIKKYASQMGNGKSIFVTSEGQKDGIVVNSEGYNYARYATRHPRWDLAKPTTPEAPEADPLSDASLAALFQQYKGNQNIILDILREKNLDIDNSDLQGIVEAYAMTHNGGGVPSFQKMQQDYADYEKWRKARK